MLAVAGIGLAPTGALAIGLHHVYGLNSVACAAITLLPSVLGLLGAAAVKAVHLLPEIKREQTISEVTRAVTRTDHPLPVDSAERLLGTLTSGPRGGSAEGASRHRKVTDAPGE